MRRQVSTLLVSLLVGIGAAACGGDEVGSGSGATASGGNGGAGNGGNGGTTSAGTTTTTTTSTTTTTTWTVSTGSGGAAGACDPAAPADSLFALADTDLDENLVSMCKYRGDVLLIVNVAEA